MDYSHLSLREKIFKTFIVTIREINTHGGPEEFFRKYPVGGMYYSEAKPLYDAQGLEVGTATTYEMLNRCKAASQGRLWVVADGAAAKNQKNTWRPTQSIGASRNLEDAYNLGKIIGMQMNDKGIDCVLGPCIDMYLSEFIYIGATVDDPDLTAKIYRQMIRGIQEQGVCATAKHFPGMGTHFMNMHMSPGENILPFDRWMETYGYTYQEMIKEGVMSVMTTHTTLRSYDNEGSDGYYPIATYSKKLTTDLLKEELGFPGCVITDALIMGGMATGDLIAETVQAFKAGADHLLWPPVEAAEAIEQAILNGEIPLSRLEDALERIGRLEDFRLHALAHHQYEDPDPAFIDKEILEMTERGICCLRNKISLLPVSADKYHRILIVDATQNSSHSSELLQDALQKRGMQVEIQRDIYDVPSRVCWQADIDKLQSNYDLVIFNFHAEFLSEWGVPHMLIWASHLFDKKKKLIVNYGSPYFAVNFFPEDPTIIEMNCSPSEETVEMLAAGILGEKEFTGKTVLLHR